MKILNILTLSSIVAPTLAMPFTTNGHNVASANRKMTVAEANSDLELLTNPNLQLKKLMNSSGDFNALSLNKDYAENQLFPNHKLYQFFFRDGDSKNDSWKVIQKQELNITNKNFITSLKKNENGFFMLPVLTLNSEIDGINFLDTNLKQLRNSIFVSSCSNLTSLQDEVAGIGQEQAPTNSDIEWSYWVPNPLGIDIQYWKEKCTAYNEYGYISSQEHLVKQWTSPFEKEPADWSKTSNFNRGWADSDSKAGIVFSDIGKKDGTNFMWDWKKNMVPFIANDKKAGTITNDIISCVPWNVSSTSVDYNLIFQNGESSKGILKMNSGWMGAIWKEAILGSDSTKKHEVGHHFNDTCGFGGENGLWKNIIPTSNNSLIWAGKDIYGGAFTGYRPEDTNRSWANILYFDINKLLETNWIGKDSEKGYYASADLNKEISHALLGILYQKQFIENVVLQDWSTLKDEKTFDSKAFPELKLNNCFYFNDVLGQSNFGGGIKTWLGWDNETGKCAVEESTKWKIEDFIPALWSLKQNILKLVSNMKPSTNISGEENIYLTYQNYFTFKNWVNKYVREHINADTKEEVLPINIDFYLKELQNGYKDKSGESEIAHSPECIDYNNPFTYAQKYKFLYLIGDAKEAWGQDVDFNSSINYLKTLILILPQLQLSEWSMVGRQDTTTNDVTIDFDNAAQNANVGKHKFESYDVSYSSGTEMLEPLWNSSNIFPIKTEYAADDTHDMIISTNIQTNTNLSKNIGTSDSTVEDEGATTTHKAGTIQNIAELAAKTDGAISVGPEVKYTYGTETHNLNETIRVKKNAKIIENVKNCELLGVPYHVSVKEDLLAHQSDVIWQRALRDNGNDIIKALKSIYQCQNTETKEVGQGLPFVECDLFNDMKATFDLSSLGTNRYLKVVPDATKGTLTTYLMYKDPETNDETVIDEYVSKGFTTNNPEPIDPTGDKINVRAIVGGTVGGVVLAGGIAAGSVFGVRHAKLKKKEKEFDAEVKEEETK